MYQPSLALHAAICALRGESDLNAVRPALNDWHLLPVLAFAPDADPIIRAIAALAIELDSLLSSSIVSHPVLQDAVVRMIGTEQGSFALASCARIAPGGWGTAHAAKLLKAVEPRKFRLCDAVALIGPCDMAARLIDHVDDIASAVCSWGQSTPERPTAWMHAICTAERDRLLHEVRQSPFHTARCLPWLPLGIGHQMPFDDVSLDNALSAFAEASSTAHAAHAVLLQRLIARASPKHLGALTRLACAMTSEDVWSRVQTLIQTSPDDAAHVVNEEPWDDLDTTVHAAILEQSNQSDICAAIAAARGRKVVGRITEESSAAFFAALDPKVWDALTSDEQRRWLDEMRYEQGHLAVRSLGLRPEILVRAELNNTLVRAAQRHALDDGALLWTLLPLALGRTEPDAAYALFNALPTPSPDPGAFFAIASAQRDPDRVACIRTTVRTHGDLQIVYTINCITIIDETILACCAALQDALHGRTWNDLAQFMPFLGDWHRAVLTPDPDDLVQRLAIWVRRIEMRQALERLASLPPEVALPTFFALRFIATSRYEPWEAVLAAEAIASALRAHGDLFLTIAEICKLLPLPKDAALADALRDMAHDDPLSAHCLAHALHDQIWSKALHALMTSSPRHADVIWQVLNDAVRSEIIASVDATPLVIDPISTQNPIAALALATMHVDDDDLHDAGIAALAARSAWVRSIWTTFPLKVQQSLREHPEFADLMLTHDRTYARQKG